MGNDVTTPAVISLDVMAERVYTNLRNAGDTTTVVFDTFLSTLRTQFELESGREWKQNFLKITRRMFSKLVAENITSEEDQVQETDESESKSSECKTSCVDQ